MKLSRMLPLVAVLAACSTNDDLTSSLPLAPNADRVEGNAVTGQVYTATNSAAGNAVLVFNRASDGALSPAGSFATNGMGSGSGLGNQNGVIISSSGRELLVVNAASNSVTSFRIRPNGSLERVGTWPSGGMQPISIAEWGGVVYVLNAGGSGGIAGFRLLNGRLSPIAGSARALSQAGAGPAQIQFARGGTLLVVTEKATNRITTYTVGRLGVASAPIVSASNGQTPFGFAVVNGLLIVSEAFGGATDASALSSYEVSRTGQVRLISGSVGTTETAACWVAVTGDGRFAYTTNTGSNSISGYAIKGGTITLLDNDGVTATTAGGPIDLAVSRDSKYIYALTASGNAIDAFEVSQTGALTPVSGGAVGLPPGTNGLAAR